MLINNPISLHPTKNQTAKPTAGCLLTHGVFRTGHQQTLPTIAAAKATTAPSQPVGRLTQPKIPPPVEMGAEQPLPIPPSLAPPLRFPSFPSCYSSPVLLASFTQAPADLQTPLSNISRLIGSTLHPAARRRDSRPDCVRPSLL